MSKFVGPEDMEFIPKKWGWESWLVNNEKFCGKILFLKKGQYLSYHYHLLKSELLYLQSGSIRFVLSHHEDGSSPEEKILTTGEGCYVDVKCPHQIEALEDSYIFEVSTTHFDSDSLRLSPSKGDGGPRITCS